MSIGIVNSNAEHVRLHMDLTLDHILKFMNSEHWNQKQVAHAILILFKERKKEKSNTYCNTTVRRNITRPYPTISVLAG